MTHTNRFVRVLATLAVLCVALGFIVNAREWWHEYWLDQLLRRPTPCRWAHLCRMASAISATIYMAGLGLSVWARENMAVAIKYLNVFGLGYVILFFASEAFMTRSH